MKKKITNKKSLEGPTAIHVLQGGGPAWRGCYIKNLTWCGIPEEKAKTYKESNKKPTCKTCLRIIASLKKQGRYK